MTITFKTTNTYGDEAEILLEENGCHMTRVTFATSTQYEMTFLNRRLSLDIAWGKAPAYTKNHSKS